VHKVILPLVALAAMALSLPAATPAKAKKKGHSTTPTAPTRAGRAPHATSASKGTHLQSPKATKAPKASKFTKRGKKTRAVSTRSYQTAPTPERYQEIQQALASKGYFHGDPNGQWGADSVDALKRFQASQNLMPDGKISSLSLIALGLGPKRLTASKSDAASPIVPQGVSPSAPGAVTPQTSTPALPAAQPTPSTSTNTTQQ
jgi:hypothetical protein